MINMIILGIDPGFAITGYGLVKYEKNRLTLLDYGVVSTKAGEPFTQRLLAIDAKLRELCIRYKPDCCAIEELFSITMPRLPLRRLRAGNAVEP